MYPAKTVLASIALLCLALPLGAADLPCRPCAGLRLYPAAAAPAPAPTPTIAATTEPSVTVAPAAPSFELRVNATPPALDIAKGDEKLGPAPGPYKITGDKPVELTFSAAGYKSATKTVDPSTPMPIEITLEKEKEKPAPSAPRKTVTKTEKQGDLLY